TGWKTANAPATANLVRYAASPLWRVTNREISTVDEIHRGAASRDLYPRPQSDRRCRGWFRQDVGSRQSLSGAAGCTSRLATQRAGRDHIHAEGGAGNARSRPAGAGRPAERGGTR